MQKTEFSSQFSSKQDFATPIPPKKFYSKCFYVLIFSVFLSVCYFYSASAHKNHSNPTVYAYHLKHKHGHSQKKTTH